MNALVQNSLQRLAAHYRPSDVEEIALNRPGEVWVRRNDGGWRMTPDASLTEDYVLLLCQQLANVSGQTFHRLRHPILYTTLPEGHRFTAVVGAGVRYDRGDNRGIAVNVRVFDSNRRITLDRYGLRRNTGLDSAPLRPGQRRYDPSPLEDLLAAVRNHEAILISGATSTGKTSFLTAMIDHLSSDARIITVEDAREVIVPHPNRVHLVVSRTDTAGGLDFVKVVDAVVRMTPDVIICGEIGITNAPGVFRLMTTGHTNFMATIHASSPEAALRAFYQNLAQTNPGIDADAAIEIIGSAFGRIVQIDRHDSRRLVTAIDIPRLARQAVEAAEGEAE